MKFQKKHSSCLNCGYSLDKSYNYCPSCGQENTDSKISLKIMIGEFISNYFALDSRFGRTIKPFFIKPGELTVQFMKGKRRTYAHPVRMYLIFSLLFFAVITGFSTRQIDQLKTTSREKTTTSTDIESPPTVFLFSKIDMEKLDSLSNNNEYRNTEVIDLITVKPLTPAERYTGIQMVRIKRAGDIVIVSYILQNLSIMMLLVIPIFAFLLKLIYIKTNHFYITHLVHGLYLHSFAYLIIGFCFLIIMVFNISNILIHLLMALAILILYGFLSFQRIYGQSWLKTFLKFLIIAIIYFHLLSFLFLVEMIISILLY